MSIVGLRLKRDLSGERILDLEDAAIKKNIAVTRSFEKMYSSFEDIRERVATYAGKAAEKLRRQNSCCSMIYVFLHTNGFREDLPQYWANIAVHIPNPTNSSIELIKAAITGVEKIFKKGFQYKKAGIMVMNLTPASQRQLSLFTAENPKHQALMKTIDRLNIRENQKVKFAGQDLGSTWKMKQEKLSKRYTSRLNEVIIINCGQF
jgi:DNA polymerase V